MKTAGGSAGLCSWLCSWLYRWLRSWLCSWLCSMPNARPSMLLDHMAGRTSELDAINGIVPVMGRALSIPTPYNDTLTAIIRQREASFEAGKS